MDMEARKQNWSWNNETKHFSKMSFHEVKQYKPERPPCLCTVLNLRVCVFSPASSHKPDSGGFMI